ncbi:hypothetical protein F4806DRAFT_420132 [Annulohypoxylon nitens]|nr:hypothetical protein F4806DRAFT_420132 [Annulohypoxylon nitens]
MSTQRLKQNSPSATSSTLSLIDPTDSSNVKDILQALIGMRIRWSSPSVVDILPERCEFPITKSSWDFFLRFTGLFPNARDLLLSDEYPAELAPFENKRKKLVDFIEKKTNMEYDLSRNWLSFRVEPDTDFHDELRRVMVSYVTEQVKSVFKRHFPEYVVKSAEDYRASYDDAVYGIDACISCHANDSKLKRWYPGLILDIGFADSTNEDRFQAYMKRGKGRTLCILSLDMGCKKNEQDPRTSLFPPDVRFQAWTAVFDPRRGIWVAELMVNEMDLRVKVRDDPTASFELYPYDLSENFGLRDGTTTGTSIIISFQRLVHLLDKAWMGDCTATHDQEKVPVIPKRLAGQREKWMRMKKLYNL